MTTKVVYLGNFAPIHSTETHYARAFEANGCEVVRLQENDPESWGSSFMLDADLLLYTRTWDSPAAASLIDVTRETLGIPTVAVHLDIWRGLDREREIVEQSMFRCDHLFQTDGAAIEWFAARGVNAHWLPAGVVQDECYVGEPVPELAGRFDVAFVGSYSYHHEWPHRPALIDHLRDAYGDRFLHVGSEGFPHTGDALRNDDLNRLYATIPVIVGDSCFASHGSLYWSDRVYETLGRGGRLLMPTIDALWEQLGDYTALAMWGAPFDWAALDARIDGLLSLPPDLLRDSIATSVEYVRSNESYTQRAATILATVLG